MNVREIVLEELECHVSLLEEAISCLLHTILFLRNPKKVTPEDCSCQLLAPLTYARCGQANVASDVRKAIEMLNITMTNIGPKLSRGVLTLNYLQHREKSGFFGFTSLTEKVYYEKWRISVVVSHAAFLSSRDAAGEIERERARDSCRNQLQLRMLHIFQAVNGDSDFLPPEYDHELDVGGAGATGGEYVNDQQQYSGSAGGDSNSARRRASSASMTTAGGYY